MRKKTQNGVKTWTPEDENDKALLFMSEGAIFGETTFPSGWTSPQGKQVCRRGVLIEVTE